jgi:hypothetical protein
MSVTAGFMVLLSAAEDIDPILSEINKFAIDEHGTSIQFSSIINGTYGGDKLFPYHILICAHSNLTQEVMLSLPVFIRNHVPLRFPEWFQLLLSYNDELFTDMVGNIGPVDPTRFIDG